MSNQNMREIRIAYHKLSPRERVGISLIELFDMVPQATPTLKVAA